MKRILVAGATGYLGQHLVKELKQRGYWVRVLIRKETQQPLLSGADDFFIGEITQKESIHAVCETIDWVISTVGITRQKDGLTYMAVDYQGNANLLAEAQQSGVERFMYISALNGDKLRLLKIFEAKERFVDELKTSDIQHTIVRPNGFFSDMQDFLDMARKGTVYLFGNGESRLNPIHGADLAIVCVDALEKGEPEVCAGGPDVMSQNELAELALKTWHKPVRIRHLPDWIRRLTICILKTFTTSKTYGPFEFFLTAMASDNVTKRYGSRHLSDYFVKVAKQN